MVSTHGIKTQWIVASPVLRLLPSPRRASSDHPSRNAQAGGDGGDGSPLRASPDTSLKRHRAGKISGRNLLGITHGAHHHQSDLTSNLVPAPDGPTRRAVPRRDLLVGSSAERAAHRRRHRSGPNASAQVRERRSQAVRRLEGYLAMVRCSAANESSSRRRSPPCAAGILRNRTDAQVAQRRPVRRVTADGPRQRRDGNPAGHRGGNSQPVARASEYRWHAGIR